MQSPSDIWRSHFDKFVREDIALSARVIGRALSHVSRPRKRPIVNKCGLADKSKQQELSCCTPFEKFTVRKKYICCIEYRRHLMDTRTEDDKLSSVTCLRFASNFACVGVQKKLAIRKIRSRKPRSFRK